MYTDPQNPLQLANYGREQDFTTPPLGNVGEWNRLVSIRERVDVERTVQIQRVGTYFTAAADPWLAPGLQARVQYGHAAGPAHERLVQVPEAGIALPVCGSQVVVDVRASGVGSKTNSVHKVIASCSPRPPSVSTWVEARQLGVGATEDFTVPEFAYAVRFATKSAGASHVLGWKDVTGAPQSNWTVAWTIVLLQTTLPDAVPPYAATFYVINNTAAASNVVVEWYLRS